MSWNIGEIGMLLADAERKAKEHRRKWVKAKRDRERRLREMNVGEAIVALESMLSWRLGELTKKGDKSMSDSRRAFFRVEAAALKLAIRKLRECNDRTDE